MQDIQTLRRVLRENKTIAVVGLSAKWHRPSFFAAKYLKDHGYEIIPVNPNYDEILGQRCYPSLLDVEQPIDVVDVFQRSEAVMPFAEQAVQIGAKVLWLQLGVTNEAAEKHAREHGLDVIVDRCMKIEYARLFGGLGFVGVSTGVISSKRPLHVPY